VKSDCGIGAEDQNSCITGNRSQEDKHDQCQPEDAQQAEKNSLRNVSLHHLSSLHTEGKLCNVSDEVCYAVSFKVDPGRGYFISVANDMAKRKRRGADGVTSFQASQDGPVRSERVANERTRRDFRGGSVAGGLPAPDSKVEAQEHLFHGGHRG
jgi:hypothetical protein